VIDAVSGPPVFDTDPPLSTYPGGRAV